MLIADISTNDTARTDGLISVRISLALAGPLTQEEDAELLAAIDAAMEQYKTALADKLVSAIQDLPEDVKADVLTRGEKAKAVAVVDAGAIEATPGLSVRE